MRVPTLSQWLLANQASCFIHELGKTLDEQHEEGEVVEKTIELDAGEEAWEEEPGQESPDHVLFFFFFVCLFFS